MKTKNEMVISDSMEFINENLSDEIIYVMQNK